MQENEKKLKAILQGEQESIRAKEWARALSVYAPSPNCVIVTGGERTMLTSYGKNIVLKTGTGKLYLDENVWDASRTTAKHRSDFLGENTAATRRKIATGEYKLTDLNK